MRDGAVGTGDEPMAPAMESSRCGHDQKGTRGNEKSALFACCNAAGARLHCGDEGILWGQGRLLCSGWRVLQGDEEGLRAKSGGPRGGGFVCAVAPGGK